MPSKVVRDGTGITLTNRRSRTAVTAVTSKNTNSRELFQNQPPGEAMQTVLDSFNVESSQTVNSENRLTSALTSYRQQKSLLFLNSKLSLYGLVGRHGLEPWTKGL